MLPIILSRKGLYMGLVAERSVAEHGDTLITLDHDLDIIPDSGRELTFADFAEYVDDIAARLWAAGVRPAAQVAIYKRSGLDINIVSCAVARIGAVPVQLSPMLDGASVTALLQRLDRPSLVTDSGKLDGELDGAPLDEIAARVLVVDGTRTGAIGLSELAGSPRQEPVLTGLDEPALMTHTSGTTGLPKLVVHSARSLHGRYRPQAKLFDQVRTRETVATHVSYVHSRMPLSLAVVMPRGNPFVVMNDSAPHLAADIFLRTRPGFIESHPNSFLEWEPLADDPRRPLGTVKYFSSTFDAIHPRTMHRLLHASDRDSPVFYQIYGQSETGPLIGRGFTRENALDADGRCQGMPFPGDTKFRVVPRNEHAPNRDNPGYIEVQAAGRVVTYYGEQERYDKQVHDGWWRGMDVGYRTEEGCLHLLDREIDVIPTINSTLDFEDVMMQRLDEITELVLVAGPSMQPVPVVCTRDDRPLVVQRWQEAVKDFPPMADPVQMSLSELPHTATMKVQRFELARRIKEQLSGRS